MSFPQILFTLRKSGEINFEKLLLQEINKLQNI